LTNSQKVRNSVMPAKAGIQNYLKTLDSRLRGNDAKGRFKTFNETINLQFTDKTSDRLSALQAYKKRGLRPFFYMMIFSAGCSYLL